MLQPNRKWIYWLVQVVGWGAFSATLLLSMFFFSKEDPPVKVTLLQIIIGIICLLSTHAYRWYIRKNDWFKFGLTKLIFSILGGTLVVAFLAQVLIHVSMLTVLDWEAYKPIQWQDFPFYWGNVYFIMLVWAVFYFGYHYYERARNARMQEIKASAAIKEAELIALKAQINPHFLFNALNNIKALILINQHLSRDAISNLSELLRYSIRFSQLSRVMLLEEVEVVKNYLQLESIHYDQRLQYEFDIAPGTEKVLIPPMTIQVLVENAIKHGIALLETGGSIGIKTAMKDNLTICVSNHGTLKEHNGNGTGIKNVLERIRILYGAEPAFTLKQDQGLVMAQLTFPAEI